MLALPTPTLPATWDVADHPCIGKKKKKKNKCGRPVEKYVKNAFLVLLFWR